MNDPALDNALRLRRAGRLAEAADIYSQILRANPNHFEALHSLGILRYQSGQIDEAERLIGAAIAVEPRADAIYNRACMLLKLGRVEAAIGCFGEAIAVRPDYVEALTNRGGALMQLRRYAEAKADFDAVLVRAPALAQAWNNAGSASIKLRRFDEALERLDKALALRPDYGEAWRNRGLAFLLQGFLEKALADFDKAIDIDPKSADAWQHRGDAVTYFDPVQAIANYDRALLLRPDHAETIFRRASALLALRRFEEAALGFRRVLEKDSEYEYARGALLFCLQSCCDWTSRKDDLEKLQADLKEGYVALAPFSSLVLLNDPAGMQAAARYCVGKQYPSQEPVGRSAASSHERIRVAYLSANFNDHAVARLIAGVFEHHDKSRFETVGIGFGAANGEMHARIARTFDRFLDVRTKYDRDVAQLIAEMEVDIAVDLMGFTEHCRLGILAFRPAPIQVNYLGFPGTMGADYIDYIIADPFVLKDDQQRDFTEQVVYLPDCYLPNDAGRRMTEPAPTRSQAGLPETGFVFCSFNQTYKFAPDLFDIWMRVLRTVDGSVLWLPLCAPAAMQNLKREAEARGVAAQRVVFAAFAGTVEDHLSRLRLADLFLDTLPYNSHTSTCDALFAGVPLVTCPGATFAGRVAASALHAHGVPELIADSLAAYEALALSIARNPQKAAALRAKIARHRDTHALFDTARFTRNLERAYTGMWQRHKRGEPPRGFSVEAETMRPLA